MKLQFHLEVKSPGDLILAPSAFIKAEVKTEFEKRGGLVLFLSPSKPKYLYAFDENDACMRCEAIFN